MSCFRLAHLDDCETAGKRKDIYSDSVSILRRVGLL
jgi:hypothetical protein